MAAVPPEPSWRKPVGILGLLAYLALYAGLVASCAAALATLPMAVMVLGYAVAGVAWVLPLRPLFLWMNTGHWTRKDAPR